MKKRVIPINILVIIVCFLFLAMLPLFAVGTKDNITGIITLALAGSLDLCCFIGFLNWMTRLLNAND